MKQFIKTTFSLLLKESSIKNVCPLVWENAYDEFAGALFTETARTPDMLISHQSLCYVRVELISLRGHLNGGSGEKYYHGFVFGQGHLAT
jgi:hypothetical protein